METKKQLTSHTLTTMLHTLKQQNNNIINWYTKTILNVGQISRFPDKMVYLPYLRNDEELIRRLFAVFLEVKYPSFIIDKYNEEAIKQLIKTYTKSNKKPGVIFYGPVGTGKTTLLLLWLEFRLLILGNKVAYQKVSDRDFFGNIGLKPITNLDATTLKYKFIKDGFAAFEKFREYAGNPFEKEIGELFFFDDFGLAAVINYYGEQVNLHEELIYVFYEKFKSIPEFEFYISTNLLPKKVKEGFNPRVYSRLNEMAEWVPVLGNDRRKEANNVGLWPTFKPYNKEVYRPKEW